MKTENVLAKEMKVRNTFLLTLSLTLALVLVTLASCNDSHESAQQPVQQSTPYIRLEANRSDTSPYLWDDNSFDDRTYTAVESEKTFNNESKKAAMKDDLALNIFIFFIGFVVLPIVSFLLGERQGRRSQRKASDSNDEPRTWDEKAKAYRLRRRKRGNPLK